MFTDIVEIMLFTIALIKNDKIYGDSCIKVYDAYRTLYTLNEKVNLVIVFLSREIDDEDIYTSHGTSTKKWIWFNNEQIAEYENIKYALFGKLCSLDYYDVMDQGPLCLNFLSKSLNHKIDEYTQITNIDDDLKLHIYRFDFIKETCPSMRHFDELFKEVTIDISSDENKQILISEVKNSYETLKGILEELEIFIAENYSSQDLLLSRQANVK